MLSKHLVTKRYEWSMQIHYLCYYQWLQFTSLTEGDTSPLTGGSPHTAVFSIRTVVSGTTRQNICIINSGHQLVPSCRLNTFWHCRPIRELPLYIISVCGVAEPGTWWISIGRSSSSWSNIREWDDLSSVVSARGLMGCCQSHCMPLIQWLPNLPATSTSYIDNSTRFLTVIFSCTAYQLTQSLSIHKRNTSQQTAEK